MARYRKTKHKNYFVDEEFQITKKDTENGLEIFKPENWSKVPFESLKLLAMAVVENTCLEYREAWKNGAKNSLRECEAFLKDQEKISLYTLNEFSSDFIMKKLKESCLKKYGPFEEIYEKKCRECEMALKPIDEELHTFSEEYLMKEKLTPGERAFIHKYDVKASKAKFYRNEIKKLSNRKNHTDPVIEEKIKEAYIELKKNKNTDKDREKYKKLKDKLKLSAAQKRRVKLLNKKAKPWTDLLYA